MVHGEGCAAHSVPIGAEAQKDHDHPREEQRATDDCASEKYFVHKRKTAHPRGHGTSSFWKIESPQTFMADHAATKKALENALRLPRGALLKKRPQTARIFRQRSALCKPPLFALFTKV
jgi:hypothetical protein